MARHAQANKVEVRLGVVPQELNLVIRDNGTGFDPETVLRGIQSRHPVWVCRGWRNGFNFAGGTVTITSAPGEGRKFVLRFRSSVFPGPVGRSRHEQDRVLPAEDHTLVRWVSRALLEKMDEVAVIGEKRWPRGGAGFKELKPDVVLMDIAMSGMNGLEATSRMCQECPNAKVIMLTMYTNEEYLKEALRAGASGYLLKDADRSELELALKAVCRGNPTSLSHGEIHVGCLLSSGCCRCRAIGETHGTPTGNSPVDRRRQPDKADCTPARSECQNRGDASSPINGAVGYSRHSRIGAAGRSNRAGGD